MHIYEIGHFLMFTILSRFFEDAIPVPYAEKIWRHRFSRGSWVASAQRISDYNNICNNLRLLFFGDILWLTTFILGLDEMLYMYVNGIYMYVYDILGNGGKWAAIYRFLRKYISN